MNDNYRLFLDLDGVLVDFESGFKNIANGISLSKFSQTHGKKAPKNQFLGQNTNFWANLGWIHGGKELWDASSRLFKRVYILSSAGATDPSRVASVIEGKKLWVKKNITSLSDDQIFIVMGKHIKQKYAVRNSILVDDVRITIEQWNKNGGYGILHDSTHYQKTIEELEDLTTPIKLAEMARQLKL